MLRGYEQLWMHAVAWPKKSGGIVEVHRPPPGLYSAFLARIESTSDRGISNRPQSVIAFTRPE
jgi:hypothetical protein